VKLQKEIVEYTLDELVQYSQGRIILSIPTGDFNAAVWAAMDLALRWKSLQDEKKALDKKKPKE
jgi:hypothetical protein